MLSLLFSIFGSVIIDRFAYRLEIFQIVFPENRKKFLALLNLPLVLLLFFKEPISYFIIYIGLILLSLIFFSVYFNFFLKKLFFQSQIRFLEASVLQMKSGSSAQKAFISTWNQLNSHEKLIFEPIFFIFDAKNTEIKIQFEFSRHFFEELRVILLSNAKIIDQLDQYRRGLKIQISLRHKSRMALMQIRAQLVVAIAVYVFMFVFACRELDLMLFPKTIVISITLITLGAWYIFTQGEKIKWKI